MRRRETFYQKLVSFSTARALRSIHQYDPPKDQNPLSTIDVDLEFELIQQKQSNLPSSLRKRIVELFERRAL
jgi:hypothetical protein